MQVWTKLGGEVCAVCVEKVRFRLEVVRIPLEHRYMSDHHRPASQWYG